MADFEFLQLKHVLSGPIEAQIDILRQEINIGVVHAVIEDLAEVVNELRAKKQDDVADIIVRAYVGLHQELSPHRHDKWGLDRRPPYHADGIEHNHAGTGNSWGSVPQPR